MKYGKSDDNILKGVNFSIKSGEKVGIVGRTGAGKSSLLNALFRMNEIDTKESSIIISGTDISNIGLHNLRQNISIIPQNPFVFKGTIRVNIFENKIINFREILTHLISTRIMTSFKL